MGLFRRSQGASDQHTITSFWTWWAEEGHKIDPHQASRATDELTRRVAAIHPDLTCHCNALDRPPDLDRHQTVSAAYAAQENGLPTDAASLDALREIEIELESLLGSRGVLVAHETHRGVRAFHAYTDGEDQNIDAALGDWASTRRLSVESQPDPAWSDVKHFAG